MNTSVQHATSMMLARINQHIVANNHTVTSQATEETVALQLWSVSEGRRYLKATAGGSAVAFIDKMTGEIYKPASFAAPAKGVRGNVLSESNGDEALDYVTGMALVAVRYK